MNDGISYEEYLPTDTWALQDWYLLKMIVCEQKFNVLMNSWYGGSINRRALVEFMALVKSYFVSAKFTIKSFLDEDEFTKMSSLLETDIDKISLADARELMDFISLFHYKSGLSKLTKTKLKGDFAHARAKLGLVREAKS